MERQVFLEISIALFSFFGGWLLNHLYSRRASKELKSGNDSLQHDNRELRRIVEKIPAELHSLIVNDPRATLTMQQIAQLVASISQLQDFNAPRQLTPEQRQQLITGLRQLESKQMRIVSTGGDDEADHFRDQLTAAFRDAGWTVGSGTAMAAMNVNGLSLDYFGGRLSSSAPASDDTRQLQSALEHAGLKVRTRSLPEDECDLHWFLSVGHKPRMS